MSLPKDFSVLPDNLPAPTDDHACDHLKGISLPKIQLRTTRNRFLKLADIQRPTIFFFYPRTGVPNEPAFPDWDLIPGARGCTPQACGFRDLYNQFSALGYEIYGVSSQDSEFQKEFVSRNHIQFEILSDADFELTTTLRLPTFQYNGTRLIKRMAWIIGEGKIRKIFYPVFPPDKNAEDVLKYLVESTA